MEKLTYQTDRQVATRYGIDRTTVHRWAALGIIPRSVKLGPGTSRWIKEELDARDAERAAAREAS